MLDPACGSGNFLYLSLLALKDLEHRAMVEGEALGFQREFPQVGPEAVLGIEVNPYAAELARVSVWIGHIQWARRHGLPAPADPVLRTLNTIECRDALLNADGSEAQWPPADAVIGNPPFLGNKRMMQGLGVNYVTALRAAFAGRVSGGIDFVVYWFIKSWDGLQSGRTLRAGLVATNSVCSGANREALKRIAESAFIFDAWSDEEWTVEGADVRVSLVCFARCAEGSVRLNGQPAGRIFADLTSSPSDITKCLPLRENAGVSFVDVILNGMFEVPAEVARGWLAEPANVNGRGNSDVLRLTFNGDDFNGERDEKWVVDFGPSLSQRDAAFYERPFAHLAEHVKPYRQRLGGDGQPAVRAKSEREIWWRHARARPAMRKALAGLSRYIATPMVSSYRTFDFLHAQYLPDQKLVVFARDDLAFFGVLHSRYHEAWTVRTCSWIGAGNDITYSNQAVFLTFPFPAGLTPSAPVSVWADDPRAARIGEAAARLHALRTTWLRPPELVRRVPEPAPVYPDRLLPVDGHAATILRTRTLTNLYSKRPSWLFDAHSDLDAAVAAAYGWPADISDDDALARLLALNLERAGQKS